MTPPKIIAAITVSVDQSQRRCAVEADDDMGMRFRERNGAKQTLAAIRIGCCEHASFGAEIFLRNCPETRALPGIRAAG